VKKIRKKATYNKFVVMILLFSLALIVLSAISTVSASSSIIYVNGSHGNDAWNGTSWATAKLTIQSAVGTVSNGGTINIANGIYKGTGNTGITISKDMTIVGQSRAGTIINGTDTAQIFLIPGGNTVTIANLTLANGNKFGGEGGAIDNYGTLTVNGCTFTGNTATYSGGAIINDEVEVNGNEIQGTLTVNGCSFTGNTAISSGSEGGAICNYGTALTVTGSNFTGNTAAGDDAGGAIYTAGACAVTGSTFKSNKADDGGAIYSAEVGILNINGCTFTSNTATDYYSGEGGAIYNGCTCTVSGCTFTNNTAHNSDGGAIYSDAGTLNVIKSTFTGNTAGDGGAIYNFCGNSATPTTIGDCTFIGNTATSNEYYDGGGAIYNRCVLTVTSSTFKSNTATATSNENNNGGGAIYNGYNTLTAHFNRFVGNAATSGNDIYSNGGTVDANCNWWGSNAGPAVGRIVGTSNPTTWLILKIADSPTVVSKSGTSTVTVNLTYDNKGVYHNPAYGHVPDGIPVTFTTTLGSIGQVLTVNGIAKTTLNSGLTGGVATVSAKVDNQTVHTSVTVTPLMVTTVDPANNEVNVSVNQTITVKFSESIKAGTNYIELKNSSGIAVPFTTSINNNVLTIKPTALLAKGVKYNITLHTGCVTDLAGNPLALCGSSFTTSTI